MGVLKPELILKSAVPVVMAGILGIYGMIVSVILAQKSKRLIGTPQLTLSLLLTVKNDGTYSEYAGFSHLSAGLCCGLSSLVITLSSIKLF